MTNIVKTIAGLFFLLNSILLGLGHLKFINVETVFKIMYTEFVGLIVLTLLFGGLYIIKEGLSE